MPARRAARRQRRIAHVELARRVTLLEERGREHLATAAASTPTGGAHIFPALGRLARAFVTPFRRARSAAAAYVSRSCHVD